MKNKIYKIFLSAIILLAFNITSYAQGSVTWTFEGGTLTITGEGEMTNYTDNSVPWYSKRDAITSIVIDERFTTIGNWAFEDCPNLVSVTLPSGLKTIGTHAFYLCGALSDITLPDGLTNIDGQAFYGCGSLVFDELPSNLTNIGWSAFARSSGYEAPQFPSYFAIPDKVANIGVSAFEGNASLDTVVLPKALTSISERTFERCLNLTLVVFNEGLISIGEMAFYSDPLSIVRLPSTLTTIKNSAFAATTIDTFYFSPSVTSIGDLAFSRATIKSIILPEGLRTISTGMFASCTQLETVTIPASVDTIGMGAFSGCTALTSIDVSHVKVIKESAFYGTGLTSFTVPEAITFLEKNTFNRCKSLTSIDLHENFLYFGDSVFKNCTALTSFDFSAKITNIGNGAFYGCTGLTSVSFERTNTNIGNSAFANCTKLTSFDFPSESQAINTAVLSGCTAIEKLIIPSTVYKISESAFRGCTALDSIVLQPKNNNLEIQKNAFKSCTSLESITLPSLVNKLGDSVFSGCTNLKYVFAQATSAAPTATVNTFAGANANLVVAVPSSALSKYQSATGWRNITNLVAYSSLGGSMFTFMVTDTVVIVGNGQLFGFYDPTSRPWHGYRSRIKKVHFIEKNITSIGQNTFRDMTELTLINLPESDTLLGVNVFNGCTALTAINLPEGLNKISDSVFANCEALTSVTAKNPVPPVINANVFAGVNLADATLSVPADAISAYQAAEVWKEFGVIKGAVVDLDWDITNGVLSISGEGPMENYTEGGAPWYSDKSNINTVIIEEGITSVGDYAFFDLPVLATILFPTTVTSIGDKAFAGCTSMNSFTVANSVPATVAAEAFMECHKNATLYVPYGTKSTYQQADEWKEFGRISDSIGGTAGTLTWTLVDSTLNISGEGAMPEYSTADETPWYNYRSGITTVVIEAGITHTGSHAFSDHTSISSAELPESLISIGYMTFSTTGLTSIEIPLAVTGIGNYAFKSCIDLTEVTVLNPQPLVINPLVFYETSIADATLYVPAGAKEAYEAADVWKEFGNIIENTIGGITGPLTWTLVDNLLTISGEGAMPDYNIVMNPVPWTNYLNDIRTVVIEDGVSHIGRLAFAMCPDLDSVRLPSTLITMGEDVFATNTSLSVITLPATLEAMGSGVFYGCTSLTTVTALNPTPIDIVAGVFSGVDLSSATLNVPTSSKTAYETADVWKEFGTINEPSTSIVNKENNIPIRLYPNPAVDMLYIESPATIQNVIIYNMNGTVVLQQNNIENVVNVSTLINGTYILRLTTDNGIVTSKFVKN